MIEDFEFHAHKLKFVTYPGVFAQYGLDYGSKLLLNALDLNAISENASILDLGCGCGILGLSLAKYFPKSQVWLVDCDIRAVRNSIANADLNQIKNVKVEISDWTDDLPEDLRFDLMVSNPPGHQNKEVLGKFVNSSFRFLKSKGCLVIVINRMMNLIKLIEDKFGNVEILTKKQGYLIIKARKN